MKRVMILAVATCTLFASCSQQERKSLETKNDSIVQVFCSDTILTYHSIGSVGEIYHGCGFYFINAETGKFMQVSGTIVVTEK